MLDEMIYRYARHRPGHSLGKNIKLHEMKKEKKTTWVFLLQKYGKF